MFFFFQAEDGIRDRNVTGVQTCALPISLTVAAGGSHQQVATFLDDRQAQQLVIAAETHALNAGSCTAQWAQLLIIGSKANGLALRSEEHTSELQSRFDLVCRLLLAKKNLDM